MKKNISITVISKACGISTPTLRIWEKRYGAFNPARNKSGERLYSEEDLLKAKLIALLLEKGHTISTIVYLSTDELKNLMTDNQGVSTPISKLEIKKLIDSLEKFHLNELLLEMQFQKLNMGVKDFVFKIVLSLMQEVGVLVAKNKLSITQEHIISSLIRDQLSKIYIPPMLPKKERISLATPEGNMHELGILIGDVLCKTNRVNTYYLGSAHPADSLGQALNLLDCSYLILGVTSSDLWSYEKNIIPYLVHLDKHLKRKIKIGLGGGHPLELPKFKNIKEVKFFNSFLELDDYLSIL